MGIVFQTKENSNKFLRQQTTKTTTTTKGTLKNMLLEIISFVNLCMQKQRQDSSFDALNSNLKGRSFQHTYTYTHTSFPFSYFSFFYFNYGISFLRDHLCFYLLLLCFDLKQHAQKDLSLFSMFPFFFFLFFIQ